jgi:hypothetical protein
VIEAPVNPGADASGTDTDEGGAPRASRPRRSRTAAEQSKRRFTIAVCIGTAFVSLPYLWVLWDLWTGTATGLRSVQPDNFYELQARGMFAGHLWVSKDSLGIEGFLHGGHTYTYFGIWPSIIRMPILAVTHTLDGILTAPSLLVAWLLTAVFTALLIWRVRILMRGDDICGRAEAAAYGMLMAAILAGSVLVYIAANPSTYDEDFAWSVALVVGALFTLLGMMERPTVKGVVASGLLILAANLNRSPTGYACVIAALLVAGWFAMGKGGKDRRRWAWWMAAAGIIPLLANCAVTYAKFGLPFGLPMAEQVWAHINAHRRYFLAANGGKAFSFSFIPSTLWAYVNPSAIRFSSLFPFIAAPATPAHAVNKVVLDQTYATTSITAASPLLFLLSCWGLVTAFRPKGVGNERLTRLVVIGAAIATGGILVWGYIAYRYVADLMPLLIIASAIGLVDIWRRLQGRSIGVRGWTLAAVCAVGLYGIAANMAITSTPSTWFSKTQVSNFVAAQQSWTPVALHATAVSGSVLPYYAPAGTLFVAGHCDALYRSTGDSYAHSPGQQAMHAVWAPVEQGTRIIHTINMQFNIDHWTGPSVPVLTYDDATLFLRPAPGNKAFLQVMHPSPNNVPWPSSVGFPFPQQKHGIYTISVATDPYLKSIRVDWYGSTMLNRYLAGNGPAVVATTPNVRSGSSPQIAISEVSTARPDMSLCKFLERH